MEKIKAIQADITLQKVDAIVNAANTTLLGGGGVDGAIHRAAGPKLLEECRVLKGCPTGEAKITHGYNLPARYVIHTVGPVWYSGGKNEDQLLENCYRNSMELAEKKNIRTLAFPSISTGAYRFPVERAARIAVGTVQKILQDLKRIEQVIFVCFSAGDLAVYQKILAENKSVVS